MMVKVLIAIQFVGVAGWNSCSDFCNTLGFPTTAYVEGNAPLCGGDCADCHSGDICGPLQDHFSDGGATCLEGSKQCCCKKIPAAAPSLEMAAQSCNDYCVSKGIKYGYVRGTAPLCRAGPDDCCHDDFPGPEAKEFSDGGAKCGIGTKQCCCGTQAGQSGCPKPGPGSLSCFVIKKACNVIAGKAISSIVECQELVAEAAGICEAVGLGPEDPFADICAATIGTLIETACVAAVKEGKQFGANECIAAANCATSSVANSTMYP